MSFVRHASTAGTPDRPDTRGSAENVFSLLAGTIDHSSATMRLLTLAS